MFIFGDRVKYIRYNDAKIEGSIMATSAAFALVMFETKQNKLLNIGCIEYKCDIFFNNTNYTYAYDIPIRYIQKIETEKSQQHNDNNLFNDETKKLHVKPTKEPKIIKKIWKWKKNGIHIKIIKIVEENSFVPHEVDLDE